MARQWPLAMLIYFPFLVVSLIGGYLIPHFLEYSREVIAFFLFCSIGYGLVLLLPTAMKRATLPFLTGLYGLSAFIKLSFYFLYQVRYSSSALFVLFETNSDEAGDYLSLYFGWQLILLAAILLIPFIISLVLVLSNKGLNRIRDAMDQQFPIFLLGLVFILMLSSAWLITKRYPNENISLTSLTAYKEFNEVRKQLSGMLAVPTSEVFKEVVSDSAAQTHIIVIGESTSRWHLQLYKYPRETNPLLSKKKELMAFNDVITPHVHTLLALEKIMTLSDYDNPQPKVNGSVVQLANAAGYKTFWISNQQPVGLHESISTIISNAAADRRFETTNGYQYTIHDQSLINPLKKALSDPTDKKIIFVHLIGTHARYYKRYPKNYDVFKGQNYPSGFKSKDAQREINQYDNAVLYNDFVISSMIDLLDSYSDKGSLLYFSDHGDEVYDTMEMAGHNEYWATSSMYEVPFLLWAPDRPMSPSQINQPYLLDDFIHSFADLTNIRFTQWDASKSIFNQAFKPKQRLIKEGEDYDLRPKAGFKD